MTSPTVHQHPANERWRIHCHPPDPDGCPGCFCAHERAAVRAELVRMIGPTAADHLLADQNLRIELSNDAG